MEAKYMLSALVLGELATVNLSAQQPAKPNLVLFIADDCSYYDLGCYGSRDSKTPNIDRFASEGMLFTQAYQAAPMSSPTRHNLFTGLWPVRTGAYPNHTSADEGTLSIVHHLQPEGYRVALIGKSHVGPDSVFPFDFATPLINKGEINFKAVDQFIAQCQAEQTPYCLLVTSHQPHTPWNKGDASRFDAAKLNIPPIYVDSPHTREQLTRYLAEVNFMDNEFGTLLDILKRRGDDQRSVVVYLSEQGNSLPFAKWTCYDAGVHSACIVRWPGVIKAGSRSNALVEYVDIVPTFVDIAGGRPVGPFDGLSFKRVLLGQSQTHKQYSFSLQTSRGIHHGPEYYGIRSVYDGQYRYIVNLTPEATFKNTTTQSKLFKEWEAAAESDSQARWLTDRYQHRPAIELYDVPRDPYCLKNLANDAAQAETVRRLDKVLRQWMADCGDQGQPTEMEALNHIPSVSKDAVKRPRRSYP